MTEAEAQQPHEDLPPPAPTEGKGEFLFKVHVDQPEAVLDRVFRFLEDNNPMKALSTCCEYYAALRAQIHLNAALGLYKKHLGIGEPKSDEPV